MPKRIKDEKERAVAVQISLPNGVVERLNKNVIELQNWLISKGADELKIRRQVTRSYLMREMLQVLASSGGIQLIKGSIALALGIDDENQTDLFEKK